MSKPLPRMYVKPGREGLIVRYPDDPRRILPPEGAWVPRDTYWTRRLRKSAKGHVDCIECAPPATKEG